MASVLRRAGQRIAAIELGSRRIRLLVADVLQGRELRLVDTQVRKIGVIEALRCSEQELAAELLSVVRNIDDLTQHAVRHGAENISVFGTEAIRKVSERGVFVESGLAERITHVLTGRQEALCSLVSGSITSRSVEPQARKLVVIDHGAGSLEIAAGQVGESIGLNFSASFPLGGTHLLEAFRTCGRNLERLRDLVRSELNGLKIEAEGGVPVIAMGTAATKCAWLTVRRGRTDRYDPKRVDGVRLPLKGLEQVFEHARSLNHQSNPNKAWERFQEFVNPGEHGGDAAERVATGVIPIIEVLCILEADALYVSSLGTRHGFALLKASAANLLDN